MNKEILYRAARFRGSLRDAKMKSWSGADKIDAELHRLEVKAFRKLAEGISLEIALEDLKKEWLEFATEQNKKVDQAPKLKHGPRSGQSVISDRWAFPEKYEDSFIFIRKVYNDAISDPTSETAGQTAQHLQ